jgi:hypothetical protein
VESADGFVRERGARRPVLLPPAFDGGKSPDAIEVIISENRRLTIICKNTP